MQELKRKYIISNEEINYIMKTVHALEDSNIVLKVMSKPMKNETKQEKGRFLGKLLGALGASFLGDLLAGKGLLRAWRENKEGKRILRACYGSKDSQFKNFLISPHPLTNFKTQNYYKNKPRFNGVYSRDYLHKKLTDGPYVINLDK